MTPIVPDQLTWASSIGLFIINFGTLDLHIQDYLENHLATEEFAKFKRRHFRDRVDRIKAHVGQAGFEPEKRQARDEFFARLEPIRELRNHIAHGLLRLTQAGDNTTWTVTLSLPWDLDGADSPEARHLTFVELCEASAALTDLCEDFMELFGNWKVDRDIRC